MRHSPLTPLTLEELKSQLRDLRASVELLKSQHRWKNQGNRRRPGSEPPPLTCSCLVRFRQEVRQLSSALDEEKKMRISLQVRTMTDGVMLRSAFVLRPLGV